jgi:hypothetical protein
VDPAILPLGANGGPTPTHALSDSSPAIDAAGLVCSAFDQRGNSRPINGDLLGGAECDIGAVEHDGPCPDVDADGVITAVDLLFVEIALGATSTSQRYSPSADIDNNSVVDGNDKALVASDLGRVCR